MNLEESLKNIDAISKFVPIDHLKLVERIRLNLKKIDDENQNLKTVLELFETYEPMLEERIAYKMAEHMIRMSSKVLKALEDLG